TTLANGTRAADGFAALAQLDSNGDHQIDANDAAFRELRVWQDVNHDGISQANELQSLSQLQIASIATQATANPTSLRNNGNWVGLSGSYTSSDGSEHATADVWFVTAERSAAQANAPTSDSLQQQVQSLAQAMAGYLHDSNQQTSATGILTASQLSAATALLASAPSQSASSTQVSNMVQQMALFATQSTTPLAAGNVGLEMQPKPALINGWLVQKP
ncbi:MAG: hypothetical protein HYZ45_14685, partial [Burkholderiales bacterium]|nr:hypothetical protein [Burkholderiales bacterium]